ncbi:MAG: sigma-54-dependent Fis family transcriptional regulator [Nitrospiraceae bacterium]|nr:MAG: sigma-54-dependent Fis family transcriptional regulator [Nitrospiraceae bacterium]
MAKMYNLTQEERDFFSLVHDAAFINPFGPRRREINLKIHGSREADDRSLRAKSFSKVGSRVAKFESEHKADFSLFTGKDRDLVRTALLFDLYHRYNDDFDSLIAEQIKAGDKTCHVPFAGEALSLLGKRGFSPDESIMYFAFFYQIRRAFYFISNNIAGKSLSMENLRCRLWDNIFTHYTRFYEEFLWDRMEDFSTLLLGETGTGKGLAASAIGRSGFIPFDEKSGCFTESFMHNFMSINLSQFAESLIESELFGHKKGAFTGAVDNYQGVLSRCTPNGTLFLDEIGDVSIPLQIKLLQVLQERTFSPVGDHKKYHFHGRVIAATNHSLTELREQGKFRDDFFYRICSDVITIPPLRQRLKEDPGELEILLEHTVKRIVGEPSPDVQREVKNVLTKELPKDYPWPGNVRELEQAVRRIILTRHYSGDIIDTSEGLQDHLLKGIHDGAIDADGILSLYCRVLYERHGTYEEVARISNLDRRTVKKYLEIKKQK